MTPLPEPLEDFETRTFSHDGVAKRVFARGEGPGVIVMTEVPGITPAVIRFADRLVRAGFRVELPDLFGDAGRPPNVAYALNTIARACIGREFHVMKMGGSSPVVDWCRALARDLHARVGGPGVGAVGMCLTGNFALSMMLDDAMIAPVLSQPSLPFAVGPRRSADLHVAATALARARDRTRDEGAKLMALRFTHDVMCPAARFETLRREFGPAAELIEIDSGPKNPHGNPIWAHSVLTEHFVDKAGHPTYAALTRVLSFFDEQLRPQAP